MTALLDAVAAAGRGLAAASRNRIAFDPRRALSREEDLPLFSPGTSSPKRHCRLIACRDGWIAVSLAREADRDMLPAWTASPIGDDPWQAVAASAAGRAVTEMVATGIELHLPVASVGEARPLAPASLAAGHARDGRVIDMSALWAGPYCGALLAEAGQDVLKIESRQRPDPTPVYLPALDRRLNGAKRRLIMELDNPDLPRLIGGARVLITSARPHALARHGLTAERLFATNPGLLWIAITAHGWDGAAALRVGFGDDCAAAGGLVTWHRDIPHFSGDALADPLTGLTAARLALEALEAGQCGLLDVSLARTAASFAEAVGWR